MSELKVPVGISNRHLHLSEADLHKLFGEGASLTVKKDLSQKGQFACEEVVNLIGPKGSLNNVRILGPTRKQTQVEVSNTDARTLGLEAPVRDSGDLKESTPIKIVGPKGELSLTEGCIVAKRHVHMNEEDAAKYGLKDRQIVKVGVKGSRGLVFDEVLIRVHPTFVLEMHLDTDEANACGLKNGELVSVLL
ncbi:MAG TPA: phosphate propanoyltransferase [Bacillota bacterium]|nr:phosphate propanoyltransferase [Bacillota bacterium]HOH10706.1 phosphate propanoyltransferase [Bacillota bacterium]HPI01603.1 phosphate propanoyltransferase [Bacillota bacterium]HPM64458.1 phosphate propanoyltransferase [Bacillota bacterium]HQJ25263.1 phosphate propanoyltransferase [Bacillota bacterium]